MTSLGKNKKYEEEVEELDFDEGQLTEEEWLEQVEYDYHKNGRPLPDMDNQ